MNNKDKNDEESRYPKRRRVYEIRFWDEEDITYEIKVYGALLSRTRVKELISNAISKLWNGEKSLKLAIEVIYKGKDWK